MEYHFSSNQGEMMTSGVYKIVCNHTGKIYVGSSKNMKARFSVHKSDLKRGKHGNPHMKEMYEKYGINNFKLEILENCNESILKEREQFWIDKLKSYDDLIGFNVHKFSTHKKSIIKIWEDPSYKKKMSEKHKKRWKDPEFREKNLKGIRDHHKEQFKKYGDYAFNTNEAKQKSKESCSTEEYRKKRSEIRLKELSTEEGKNKNNGLLNKARKSPKRKENLKKFNEWQASDEDHKKKQAEHAKKGWSDPEVRKRRIEAMKKARWGK